MAGQVVISIIGNATKAIAALRETSDAADKASTDVGKSGSRIKDWGKGAALGAGVAAGAALASGFDAALDKGKLDATLAAQLGATPDVAKKLGSVSGNLFSDNFGTGVEDIDNALKGVLQNGIIDKEAASKDIEAVTAKVLTLSSVLGEESGKVSEAVSQMLKTGMADSAEEAFDVLAKGAQNGVNKSEDLLDTFNEYGTQFRKLGLDGADSMGLLSQAIKGGARDADTAADALKEFSIRGIDGSKATVGAFEKLGLSSTKMQQDLAAGGPTATAALDATLDSLRKVQDPAEQAAIATSLFGTKAEDLGTALFDMDVSGASTALGEVAGAAQKATDTIGGSAGAKLDAFKRKAQGALIDVLGKAIPYIEGSFGYLAKNSSWVIPLATGLGALAAVVGTIVAITRVWTAVQTAFNVIMALNPAVLITLAIIALIAIIVLIATKTKFFQTIWNAVWGAIKAVAIGVFDFLKAYFVTVFNIYKAIFNGFITGVKAIWSGITWLWSKAVAVFNLIKTAISAAVGWIVTKVKAFIVGVKVIWARIGGLVTTAMAFKTKIIGVFQGWINWMKALPGKIVSGLVNGLKAGWSKVTGFLDGAIDLIPKGIRKVLGISSPSKVMAKLGKNIGQGLVVGIRKQVPAVEKVMGKVSSAVAGGVSSTTKVKLLAGQPKRHTAATATPKKAAAAHPTVSLVLNFNGVTADAPEVGRQCVKAIEAYQRRSGRVLLARSL